MAAITVLTACDDGVAPGPEGLPAGLGMSFNILGQAASVADVFDKADNLQVTVAVPGREAVTRTVQITPGQSTIEARLQITLEEATATAQVHVELKKGADPLFAGSRSVTLEQGGQQRLEVDLSAVAAQLLVPSEVEVDVLGEPVTLPGEVGFATGDPIPGAEVVWSSSETGIQVTQDGRLTAMRNGTYSVVATGGGFTKTVLVDVAAAPTTVEFVAGHDQSALPGQPVEESPVVLVTHGSIPMPGVEVAFSADKGGTVSEPVVSTDAQGRATLSRWTLGQEGVNTLTATVAGLPPATLTATAFDPCAESTPLAVGQTVSGELDDSGCPSDQYTLSLAQRAVFDLQLSSDVFHPLQRVGSEETRDFISGWYIGGPGTVSIEYALPPGNYRVAAASHADSPQRTGPYTLSTTAAQIPQEGCGITMVTDGSVATGRINGSDCEDPFDNDSLTVRRLDSYWIVPNGGETVSVDVSVDFPAILTRWTGSQIVEETRIPAGGSGSLTFTAESAGFHQLNLISDEHEGTGNYTMTFSITGSAAAPSVEAGKSPPSFAGPDLEVPSRAGGR